MVTGTTMASGNKVRHEPQRKIFANGERSRHLDISARLLQSKHAPSIFTAFNRPESFSDARQRRLLERVANELALLVPDVDRNTVVGYAVEAVAAPLGGVGCSNIRRQRQRDGAQLVVEQLARLAARGVEDAIARRQRCRGQSEDQPAEQPAAYGCDSSPLSR